MKVRIKKTVCLSCGVSINKGDFCKSCEAKLPQVETYVTIDNVLIRV